MVYDHTGLQSKLDLVLLGTLLRVEVIDGVIFVCARNRMVYLRAPF